MGRFVLEQMKAEDISRALKQPLVHKYSYLGIRHSNWLYARGSSTINSNLGKPETTLSRI